MLGIAKTLKGQDELEAALKAGIEGEVLLDRVSRGLYSTDASIYQMEPLAVVLPRSRADVDHALKTARTLGLPVLPRGGGTSLAGQTVARAIVLDFSKHMNSVLEVNAAGRWVRVEPGRVRDELNTILLPTGLHFGPETATANRANIGGMIGNNSSGTRSIAYGKTVDHVLELDYQLVTGEVLKAREMSRAEWDEVAARDTREGRIYKGVRDLVLAHREEIAARYPKVMRRVGGYNLDEFLGDRWNLAKLITGSEGTLATVLEAKLDLDPLPKAKAMAVGHFKDLLHSLRAVAPIVKHAPSMVELLDRSILGPARAHIEVRKLCDWIEGDPEAVLIVEFFGDGPAEAEAKLDAMIAEARERGFGYAWPKMLSAESQGRVFAVRAAGQGLMIGARGDEKAIDYIDDSAVPVEVLPDYIAEVLEICRRHNTPVAAYAHASVGLLHLRPIHNLKTAEGVEKMRRISEETFEIVKKHGGSWSGEHGDGLVRSYMNERYFGPKLYRAFKEIKRLFDPENLMNPGKIVDAPPMTENLRMGVQYRKASFPTRYFYREDGGGFDQAVEACTGVGACRKTGAGTMCPSYMATRDEAHTTRGRANALRLAMTGQYGPDGMASPEVKAVLDLCLGCKGCKAECPSNVDVAKLKNEFMALYHREHGAGAGERFFAQSPLAAARFSGTLAPLVNWVNTLKPVRAAMEKILGVDRRRPLPQFTDEPFPAWFAGRARGAAPGARERRVALFDDTFTNHHEPSAGRAAVVLLETLGYNVEPARAGCCGRTLISKGFLDEARDLGLATMRRINDFLVQDVPVVGLEPSCVSALTDDLPDLIDNVQLGRRVAKGVMMLDVFLERELAAGRIKAEEIEALARRRGAAPPKFLIHGHCHQKALYGTGAMKKLLALVPGAGVAEIPSGCCGMAGSFGYEKDHYEVSMKIGEDRLFPAVRAMAPGTELIACGFSCRHQIADGAGAKSRHFAEVMAEALGLKE